MENEIDRYIKNEFKVQGKSYLFGALIIAAITIPILIIKSCSEVIKKPKNPVPLTEQKKEFKESQVCIDSTKNEFSIDGHQLVQYKSDAIMHFSSCKECLKRYK